ncbi:MAG: sugar ABC transporter permease [Anaerolineae bacterium]|nr:sugar ABC transporter permease [Anaerolineae bacterium]MDW8100302.1 sugar ABC transporter permease [Anaerolineae bacterium]
MTKAAKLTRSEQTSVIAARRSKYLYFNEDNPLYGYLYVIPFLIFFVTFVIYPIFRGFQVSFTNWDIVNPPVFVGFSNYQQLLGNDDLFVTCLKNTVYYVFMYVPLGILVPMLLAELLFEPILGRTFFRSSFALPIMVPVSATALIWGWLLNPTFGLLNLYLKMVGLPPQNWLSEPQNAMKAIVMTSLWWGAGWNMILFLAGRQEIPEHLYEAAKIDGAGTWALFRHITIPGLMPTTLFVSVVTIIGSFQVFGQVLAMTNGGPGDATRTVSMFIYSNGFLYFKMGYASAAAWVLFLIVSVFTILQFRLLRSRLSF